MPNHKSAEKRMRQSEARRKINRGNRSRLRTTIKNLRGAIGSGDAKQIQELLPMTISTIDKAVQNGALHKNQLSNSNENNFQDEADRVFGPPRFFL